MYKTPYSHFYGWVYGCLANYFPLLLSSFQIEESKGKEIADLKSAKNNAAQGAPLLN